MLSLPARPPEETSSAAHARHWSRRKRSKRQIMTHSPDVAKSPLTGFDDNRLIRQFSYIGGRWMASATSRTFAVTDPATGAWLGDVASLSPQESAAAVDAAARAFPAWAGALPQERSRLLRRWFELVLAHRRDLARLMVLEQGKPISE